MPLSRLMLTDFRSYPQALITPGPGLVVLTGENGAGKTNVLEAVSLLSPGRGLRGAALAEMARGGGAGGFAVAARLETMPLPVGAGQSDHDASPATPSPTPTPSPSGEGVGALGPGTAAAAPERRQVRVNGAATPASALGEWLSVLWLTPAMDRLFAEGAGGRRRFLDRLALALEPGHASHAARYEAAMRARNSLLAGEAPDADWLSALEARMAEHGAALAAARARVVAALSERLAEAPEGPFARPRIALAGGGGADLAASLRQGRARDASAGRALEGPHRADLEVIHAAKDQPAAACSTGEQKALLLALVLAHADLVGDKAGRRPILLLDEVAAHLDPVRRAALFERLGGAGGQVWMTGTEPALFAGIGAATRLHVGNGAVGPA